MRISSLFPPLCLFAPPPNSPTFSLYLFFLSYMPQHLLSHILTCTHTPPPTNSHVGIGCRFFSCLFFFMLCLYPSWVMQLLGQGLSWLLSSSLVASLYVILVCPFLPCCLLAGLKGKCFPVAGTAQIIPADYLTNATFSSLLFSPPSSPSSRLASCLRY